MNPLNSNSFRYSSVSYQDYFQNLGWLKVVIVHVGCINNLSAILKLGISRINLNACFCGTRVCACIQAGNVKDESNRRINQSGVLVLGQTLKASNMENSFLTFQSCFI